MLSLMLVLSHRGINLAKKPSSFESSRIELLLRLEEGFSLEVDPLLLADNNIVISHDDSLIRLLGIDRKLSSMRLEEAQSLGFISLTSLLSIFESYPQTKHALHIKHFWSENLEPLIENLSSTKKVFLFDLIPEAARKIKSRLPHLELGASVCHPYDISRFGKFTGNTLLSIDEFLDCGDLYTWAWLDEWDRSDLSGRNKALYTPEVIKRLQGKKIAIVSPELHRTSPCLLGGEAHPDSLETRWGDIKKLNPDAICTDYPEYPFGLA